MTAGIRSSFHLFEKSFSIFGEINYLCRINFRLEKADFKGQPLLNVFFGACLRAVKPLVGEVKYGLSACRRGQAFFMPKIMANQKFYTLFNPEAFEKTGELHPKNAHYSDVDHYFEYDQDNQSLWCGYKAILHGGVPYLRSARSISPLREFELKILEAKIAETRAILASPTRMQDLSNGIWDEKWRFEAKYLADKAERKLNPPKKEDKSQKKGFAYLAFDEFTKHHKIGFTTNAKTREKMLRLSNSGLSITESFEGTMGDEAALHEKFKEKRVRGEWFDLTNDDLEQIRMHFKRPTADETCVPF